MDKVGVSDFKEVRKNTLRGFFKLRYGGIEIMDCALHQKDGKAWFAFPGKKVDKGNGETQWVKTIFVPDRNHLDKLQDHVTKVLAEYLDNNQTADF